MMNTPDPADSYFDGKTVADLCWWAYWDSGSTRYHVASMLLANDTLPPTIHHQARKVIRGGATPENRTRAFELILWIADPGEAQQQGFDPPQAGE